MIGIIGGTGNTGSCVVSSLKSVEISNKTKEN